jgi:hypothetical protein
MLHADERRQALSWENKLKIDQSGRVELRGLEPLTP